MVLNGEKLKQANKRQIRIIFKWESHKAKSGTGVSCLHEFVVLNECRDSNHKSDTGPLDASAQETVKSWPETAASQWHLETSSNEGQKNAGNVKSTDPWVNSKESNLSHYQWERNILLMLWCYWCMMHEWEVNKVRGLPAHYHVKFLVIMCT